MRKHFVAFMIAATVTITTALPVYAAPMTNAEAIASLHQADGRVYKNGDTANITVDLTVTDWSQTITEILIKRSRPADSRKSDRSIMSTMTAVASGTSRSAPHSLQPWRSIRTSRTSGRIPPQKRYSRPARTVIRSYRQHIFTSQATIRMRMASLPRR